jgi:hypothetical protein
MKKLIVLASLLLFLPVFSQNASESINETFNDTNSANWYSGIVTKAVENDNLIIIYAIIGLALVYVFGKIAFKFIKVAIIILLIILLLKFIF